MDSLYDRLGGEAAIMAAADAFYGRVLADPAMAPFFDGLDTGAQTRKLVSFLAWAFDGPVEYKGRGLKEAHEKLVAERGLSDVHFDAILAHLANTLTDLGVAPDLIGEAHAVLEKTRGEVLGR